MLKSLAEWVKKLDRDLLRDYKNNSYNVQKMKEFGASTLWSTYMVIKWPDDLAMWSAYSVFMLGSAALQYGQKRMNDRKDVQGEPPPAGPTTSMSVAGDATVKQ